MRRTTPVRVAVAAALAVVVLTALPGPRTAAAAADPDPDRLAVLARGHADLAPRFVDGRFRVQVRDDAPDPTRWRDADAVVLHVPDAARVRVPAGPSFAFLGRPAARVWLLPETQDPRLVWPGWSTEDRAVVARTSGAVAWSVRSVRAAGGGPAPGRFALFSTDAFGAPTRIFDSGRPLPQRTRVPVGTHAHGSWAFTAPGAYALDVEMSAVLRDRTTVRDRRTLRVVVGDRDPRAVLRAAAGPDDDGAPRLLVPALAAAAVLLIGGVAGVRRRRRGGTS